MIHMMHMNTTANGIARAIAPKNPRNPVQPSCIERGGAEEAGNDADGQAEIQPAPRLDHRHHGKNEQAVLPEAVQDVAERGVDPNPHDGRRDEEQDEEDENDDAGPAEIGDQLPDAMHRGPPPPALRARPP
jgi:hypothetical protein